MNTWIVIGMTLALLWVFGAYAIAMFCRGSRRFGDDRLSEDESAIVQRMIYRGQG